MGRRANGEGSIYKETASGLWCAVITVNGKRRVVRSKRQDVVLQKLDALRKDIAKGRTAPATSVTVAAFLTEWLTTRRGSLGEQTWETYERKVRLQIVPYIGPLRLAKLARADVQRLYDELLEDFSAQTVNHVDAVLKVALKDAVLWERVGHNAAALVKPPRVERHERRFLTPEEAQQFLLAAQGDRFETLYQLAVGTGMRRGELLGLHWRDVQLDRSSLSVNWTVIQTAGGGLRLKPPKTEESRRKLALDPGNVEALRRHRARQAEARLRAGDLWEENDLVFPNEVGRLMNPSNLLSRSYWPIRGRAGFGAVTRRLPDGTEEVIESGLRFHDLRHTAGSLMLIAGVPLKVVSARLGHANINITADIYMHVIDRLDEGAATAVGALLRGEQTGVGR